MANDMYTVAMYDTDSHSSRRQCVECTAMHSASSLYGLATPCLFAMLMSDSHLLAPQSLLTAEVSGPNMFGVQG